MAVVVNSNLVSAIRVNFKMNLSSKIFLGAGLAALVAAVTLPVRAAVNLGNIPLWFETGHALDNTTTKYIAHGHDAEFAITPAGAEFTLRQASGHQATVHMTFAGAGLGSQLTGDNLLGGKINYLLGNDPAQWQTGISTYGKVRLDQVYPGVNVVFYGNQQQLEYDFDLAAGVKPEEAPGEWPWSKQGEVYLLLRTRCSPNLQGKKARPAS